jgi:hypothetical protein
LINRGLWRNVAALPLRYLNVAVEGGEVDSLKVVGRGYLRRSLVPK